MRDIHSIDLLERAAGAFEQEEVDGGGSGETAGGEDIAVAEVDGGGDEGGEEGEEEVPGPVGGGGDGHAGGAVAVGEHFAGDSPYHGSCVMVAVSTS